MHSELYKLSDKDVDNLIKPPIHENSIFDRLIKDFNLSKYQKPDKKQKKKFKRLKRSIHKRLKHQKREKQQKQSRTTKRRFKLKK